MGTPIVGKFEHRGLEIQWTCNEHDTSDDCERWMFQADLTDITVRRYFAQPLSRAEAVAEVSSIAPELFRLAVLELVRRHNDLGVAASSQPCKRAFIGGFSDSTC
jgi:hypothetical protein